ncbi:MULTISPECIES: AAA family ATPase [unclassified Caballeronia]|uniref:AAA family ATPase n=1 Tax=unclassified Caballeronia TaxID=2646786 RepID=UPI002029525E|nr:MULTISPECIES: AAA family ATPase [unclassified Caballeronia]
MFSGQFAARANGVDIVAASEIPIQPIQWLWQNWLAVGKLHILAGPPGTGKTMLALSFAAALSNGGTDQGRWPDGSFAPFGRVLIWSGEDDVADTIVPRLVAAGADRQHVFVLRGAREGGRSRAFDFTRDIGRLREEIAAIGDIRLVIIDSIVQAVAGDSNRNSEVRRNLEPLIDMATQYGFAILGLTHVSKGSSAKDPVDRVTGSLAFAAVARIVLLTGKAQSDDDSVSQGVLVRAKSNLGPSDGGFEYQICPFLVPAGVSVAYSSAIAWNPMALQGTAREILRVAAGHSTEQKVGKLEFAIAFVRDQLAGGPRSYAEMEAQATEAGISPATLRRARERLGVQTQKVAGQGGVMSSIWSLQPQFSGMWSAGAHESGFLTPQTFSASFGSPASGWASSIPDASAIATPVSPLSGSATCDLGAWSSIGTTMPLGDGAQSAAPTTGFVVPQSFDARREQVEHLEQVERVEQVEHVEQVYDARSWLNTPTYDFHEARALQAYRELSRNYGESESAFVDRVISHAMDGSINETEDDQRTIEEVRILLKQHCPFGRNPRGPWG